MDLFEDARIKARVAASVKPIDAPAEGFGDARMKAREEAGELRKSAANEARAKIGSVVGRAEASLHEPFKDKVSRVVAGSPALATKFMSGLGLVKDKVVAAGGRLKDKGDALDNRFPLGKLGSAIHGKSRLR